METVHARLVDRQLAFARVQLNSAATENVFVRQAHLSAGCLHLVEALLAYLEELQLTSSSVQAGASLQTIFDEVSPDIQSADFRVREIIDLAINRDSWLNRLVRLQLFFRQPASVERSEKMELKSKMVESVPLIIATSSERQTGENGMSDVIEPSIDLVSDIVDDMKSLVARHREFSAEY